MNLDVALMKFCYVDFDENTSPAEVFDYYSRKIQSIQS